MNKHIRGFARGVTGSDYLQTCFRKGFLWSLLISLLFAFSFAATTLRTAEKLMKFHQYREAAAVLKGIIKQDSANEQAHFMLGKLYLRFQAYPEASAEFNAVLSFDPRNLEAVLGLGSASREQGDLEKSITYFQKAVKINANSLIAHQNLAVLQALTGNYDLAVEEYSLLVKLDPKGSALLDLAKLYRKSGENLKARKTIQQYLKIHPEDGQGWNSLAEILFDQKDVAQAWAASEHAVKLDSNNISSLITHGKIALNLNSTKYLKITVNDSKHVLSLDPGNVDANEILLKANDILSKRNQRFIMGGSLAVTLIVAGFLITAWRKKEKHEAEKNNLVSSWGRQLEQLNDPEKIAEDVFTRCVDLFELPKGMFFLTSKDGRQMRCVFTNFKVISCHSFEVRPQFVSEWSTLFQEKPMTAIQAFRTGSFSSSFPDAKRHFEKHDIRMIIPFFSKNKLLGLLALGGVSRREFRDRLSTVREKVEIGYLFAQKAAVAIETSTLYELSMIDEQTQVYNKRFFSQVLTEEIKRVGVYNQPVSLLMLDIDRFKDLNDSYGHPQGDSILKELAQTLKDNIRQGMDSVFRYGGEEFTILLPATPLDKARETAERIRNHILNYHFSGLPVTVRVTVSMGISTYPDHASTDWELLQVADKALYQSKAAGRNRVTVGIRIAATSTPSVLVNQTLEENHPS